MKRAHFLFFYTTFGLGGVETLIVRFSNWLIQEGHEVTLVLMDVGELCGLLNPKVKVIVVGKSSRVFFPGWLKRKISSQTKIADVIFTFDPISLWMMLLCKGLLPETARVVTGVYHPRIYFFDSSQPLLTSLRKDAFLRLVPNRSKAFMNEPTRTSHEMHFGISFADSFIFPLPIVDNGYRNGSPCKYRIVSVGRLTAFKTYNLYMLDIIQKLHDKGLDVKWDIYGTGELECEMRARIAARNLQERVDLHGSVPYADLTKVLNDAYAFVGMGTALVEAAAYGIPSIPAIEQAGPFSYGYVYQLPGHAVGERLAEEPQESVEHLLNNLLRLDETSYQNECRRTREWAARFTMTEICGSVMADLSHVASISEVRELSPKSIWFYYLNMFKQEVHNSIEWVLVTATSKILKGEIREKVRTWNRYRHYRRAQKNNNQSETYK